MVAPVRLLEAVPHNTGCRLPKHPRRITSLDVEVLQVIEWGHAHLETALEALENLPVFVAYNANVDAVVRIDDDLEAVLDRPAASIRER